MEELEDTSSLEEEFLSSPCNQCMYQFFIIIKLFFFFFLMTIQIMELEFIGVVFSSCLCLCLVMSHFIFDCLLSSMSFPHSVI